jgi:hypothetical protein
LKAAHDILHQCPDAFDLAHANQLQTESYSTSIKLLHLHRFDSNSNQCSTNLESDMTFNPFATLTNQPFLAKCQALSHAGELIPIQYMNPTQFTLYCASITETDIADIHQSFREISQLIHEYCPTAQILPPYLQFTIESGIILLDSTIDSDGDYQD